MRLIKRNISNALYAGGNRNSKSRFSGSEDIALSMASKGLDTYITPRAQITPILSSPTGVFVIKIRPISGGCPTHGNILMYDSLSGDNITYLVYYAEGESITTSNAVFAQSADSTIPDHCIEIGDPEDGKTYTISVVAAANGVETPLNDVSNTFTFVNDDIASAVD
jgi:hypothetical protein